MTWTEEMTRLAEPLEWFDAVHSRTLRRLGGRVVDLSFANPRFPEFHLAPDAVVEVWGVVSGSVNPRRRAE